MEHLTQSNVAGKSSVDQSLIEASDCTTIHFIVLPVATVQLDYTGFVTMGIGVCVGAAECLCPVCGEALDMLRVEAVAEGMADLLVGHYAAMPSLGKAAQTADSTCRLEDSGHVCIITKRRIAMQEAAGGEFGSLSRW